MAETPEPHAPTAHGDGVPPVVAAWHDLVHTKDPETLRALIADDAVFCSPAVHAPQVGGELTFAYLSAALRVLGPTIEYPHEWYDAHSAVLRFRACLGDRDVEGVDIITWNEDDLITEFTVMVRPLSGLHALIEEMKAQLGAQLRRARLLPPSVQPPTADVSVALELSGAFSGAKRSENAPESSNSSGGPHTNRGADLSAP